MSSCPADLVRITLLVQRLLDAEEVDTDAGAALMTAAEAGRRFTEAGDAEEARRQWRRLAELTDALIESGALDMLDGRAVVETVRKMVDGNR